MKRTTPPALLLLVAFGLSLPACAAEALPAGSLETASLTGAFIRMLGALALVVALFFAGIWAMRNWQRFLPGQVRRQKLSILEVKSLGNRQALYVVAYEQQRLLLASSASGVTILTHLPAVETVEEPAPAPALSFADALVHAVGGRQ